MTRRKCLPDSRQSITHHFEIYAKDETVEGYVTVGLHDDGTPGEIFTVLARAGEAIRGMTRCWAICFSLCLQHGVQLEQLVEKFEYFRFEPSGPTANTELGIAQSIVDYICRWLRLQFLTPERSAEQPSQPPSP